MPSNPTKNAAKIGIACAPGTFEDPVIIAAERLATIEDTRHFDWLNKPNDWESTCNHIAVYITEYGRAPSDRTIRDFINQKGK